MAPSKDTQRLIASRYRLQTLLGRGGMGHVYRARDELLRRDVAVKQIEFPRNMKDDQTRSLRARVMREAQAAARLNHPGAVTIYDVIEEEDDRAYIVMELIEASNLSDAIDERGPVSPSEAASIGLQLLDVLEVAHANGIVHRDVKPSNVMVPQDGSVKLADFGIASVKGDPSLTASGMVMGSPQFMSPEQAMGERSGPPADIWGLGATLYFAVEGKPPFVGSGPLATLTAVVDKDHEAPVNAGELGPVIDAFMDKDPSRRPDHGHARGLLAPIGDRLTGVASGSALAVGTQNGTRVQQHEEDEPNPVEPAVQPEAVRSDPYISGTASRRSTPRRTVVGFTALVVLGLIAIAALVWGFGGGSGGSGNGRHSSSDKGAGKASSGSNGGQGSGTNSGSGGTSATSTANWQPYSDTAGSYSISYPGGWQQSQPASSEVQFTDPTSGAYVLVAWTDTPGPDPAARWRSYSQSFASKHTNYHQIGIQPTTFDGMKAAAWEFTYTESGADLHAIDLGFVNSDKGYAIYTQTHSGDWSRYQNVFARFRSSFQAG